MQPNFDRIGSPLTSCLPHPMCQPWWGSPCADSLPALQRPLHPPPQQSSYHSQWPSSALAEVQRHLVQPAGTGHRCLMYPSRVLLAILRRSTWHNALLDLQLKADQYCSSLPRMHVWYCATSTGPTSQDSGIPWRRFLIKSFAISSLSSFIHGESRMSLLVLCASDLSILPSIISGFASSAL